VSLPADGPQCMDSFASDPACCLSEVPHFTDGREHDDRLSSASLTGSVRTTGRLGSAKDISLAVELYLQLEEWGNCCLARTDFCIKKSSIVSSCKFQYSARNHSFMRESQSRSLDQASLRRAMVWHRRIQVLTAPAIPPSSHGIISEIICDSRG
jgi:hypothetical protein